jgi:hypothetical protein
VRADRSVRRATATRRSAAREMHRTRPQTTVGTARRVENSPPSVPNATLRLRVWGGSSASRKGYSSFSCLYGPDAFCKLLVRDAKPICMHVSGLPEGQLPKQARSLDGIRAPCP